MDLRDPVHNFIHLTDVERKLLDTQPLQRLRGIRQLAMANLVYPGALHTRFDHSLGVMHVAGLMAKQLKISEEDIRILRLAALLHDVGHGPFSHVSEAALELYADKTAISAAKKKEKIHELVTARIICENPEIKGLIGDDTPQKIVKLLSDGYGEPALKSIISGPLDADKQDYLLRDSRFCGVQYGVFDIHQLHRSLVLSGPNDERQLMISGYGIHAVEQYVMAKYYMTTNVYRHRVRLITDQMIIRAIKLGFEKDQIPALKKLFKFGGSKAFVKNYLQWDDARFMVEFCLRAPKTACGKMLEALRSRRLHKCIFHTKIRDFSKGAREHVAKLSAPGAVQLRKQVEAAVAKILQRHAPITNEFEVDALIAHSFTIKSIRESSRNDEAGVVVAKTPGPVPFDQESTLFQSINERMEEAYCEVYAPVEWESVTAKKKIVSDLRDDVFNCIDNLCRDGKAKQGAAK